MTNEFIGTVHRIVAPSGNWYEIREQNGDDEDIISNVQDARTMANFTRFIAAIVVNNSFTGKPFTFEQAQALPLLDRYYILFMSRIHSIGPDVEFEYTWPDGTVLTYSQDLWEMVFSDYSQIPSTEELDAKPNAIPFYPHGKVTTDIEVQLPSSKVVKFDVLTGRSESWLATLPESKRSRNTELLAHNLRLNVEGNWEKVENFKLFTVKDMVALRKAISEWDPEFTGNTDLINPHTQEVVKFPIMVAPDFFFPKEI